jgi:cyanophycin synthetase
MRQHQLLIDQARKRRIVVEDASQHFGKPAAILSHQGQVELIIDGVPMSWINVQGEFFCDQKHLTKELYKKRGLPYPSSIVFKNGDNKALHSFLQAGKSYVCKPVDNTNGIGVVLNIKDHSQVLTYLRSYRTLNGPFLLEEQAEGYDLRIHVLGSKLVAACVREPAYVRGNGQATLTELIDRRRSEMQQQNPNNFLELDDITQFLLREQQLKLDDIIPDGQNVQLKRIANMAQGAIATDVTDDLHPDYKKWVTALCEELRTGYFGLDIMTKDHRADPAKMSWILEVNARADWLHHTFSEKRTHDIPVMILDELFKT